MKRTTITGVLLLLTLVGALAYIVIAGRTESWPTTACTVVSSRVVRSDGPYGQHGSAMVLYEGEYRVRYVVGGKEYGIWTAAGWMDKSLDFVQAKMESLPQSCPYIVRYNPKNPSEAMTNWR